MTLPTLLSLKPLITLLALVNPLAILPFYIHYTQSFSDEQRMRTIRAATLTVLTVLATFGNQAAVSTPHLA